MDVHGDRIYGDYSVRAGFGVVEVSGFERDDGLFKRRQKTKLVRLEFGRQAVARKRRAFGSGTAVKSDHVETAKRFGGRWQDLQRKRRLGLIGTPTFFGIILRLKTLVIEHGDAAEIDILLRRNASDQLRRIEEPISYSDSRGMRVWRLTVMLAGWVGQRMLMISSITAGVPGSAAVRTNWV